MVSIWNVLAWSVFCVRACLFTLYQSKPGTVGLAFEEHLLLREKWTASQPSILLSQRRTILSVLYFPSRKTLVYLILFHNHLCLFVLLLSVDQCSSLFSNPVGQQNTEIGGREVQGGKKSQKKLSFFPESKGLGKNAFEKNEITQYSLHG